jgi:hypothetical protein
LIQIHRKQQQQDNVETNSELNGGGYTSDVGGCQN